MDAIFFAVAGVSIIVGIAAIMVMLLVKKELRTQVEEVRRKMDFFDEKTNRMTRALVDRLDRTYSDTLSALQVIDDDLDKLETQLQQDDPSEQTDEPSDHDSSQLQSAIEQASQQSNQEVIKRLDEFEENMSERIALLRTSLINAQQEQTDEEGEASQTLVTDEQLYDSVRQSFVSAKAGETKAMDQLSRKLKVDYVRLARLVDLLEQDGIVERVEGKGEYGLVGAW